MALFHKDIRLPEGFRLPNRVVTLEYSRHAMRAASEDRYGEIPVLPLINLGECEPVEVEVIDRKVIEQLSANAPLRKYPFQPEKIPRVFRCDNDGDEERGEDIAFFSDIGDLGYTVNLDPSVELGHIGSKVYSGSIASMMEQV